MTGRIVNYAAMLLLVHALVGCSDPAPQPTTGQGEGNAAVGADVTVPTADARLVVVFGDSLYAGYGLEQNKGFAPALERALRRGGIAATVHNAGVSGDTSAMGRDRLAFALDGLPRTPDLVLVGLGGNDMLRGLDPADTRANLDAILTELHKRGIDAVLTGMLASRNMGVDYAKAFDTIYPQLAAKFDVPLYPFFLDGVIGHADLMLPDGIHPNDRGVEVIAAKVAPVVEARLAD